MENPALVLTAGYGSGDGYGDGDGSGSGYGSGDGSGYGDGDGDGSGSGSGSGDGDGDGDGSGSGYGSGYGSGDGDGSGDEKSAAVYFSSLLNSHRRPNADVAFWRSNTDGTPSNGGTGKAVACGELQEVEGPLKICSHHALHGTINPKNWRGSRWWIVALHHPVQRQEDKIGSLKRTIIADLGKCPF